MKTIKEIRQLYQQDLSPLYDVEEINALLRNVVVHHQPSFNSSLQTIDSETASKVFQTLAELKTGKPLQHILGKAYFYNLEFSVNQYTLIPRPETEELVYLIIQNHQNKAIKILDVGSGTGCIPISLKKNLPLANVSSIDISLEALEIAKENAGTYATDIVFYHDDALNLAAAKYPKYDIIVSNPPYIKINEKPEMHKNVLDFEPHLALFVEDDNALLFYDKIADFALTNLAGGGYLYFEINQYLAEETKALLIDKGFKPELFRDINGNFRFISASRI